jgi:hypothetical protein
MPVERLITGTYVNPVTGKPYDGTNGRNQYVVLKPYPPRWMDRNGDQILTGGGRVNLDSNGHFSKSLICTDDSDVLPEQRLWQIDQVVGESTVTEYISVPQGIGPLDITELLSVQIDGITYVPVPGPPGPQGSAGPAGPQPPLGEAGAGDDIALRSTDPTTTDARAPRLHADSHAFDGDDPITPAAIGAFPAEGGTLDGPALIDGVPGAVTTGLPAGYGNSSALTGLALGSTYPSDDVSGGVDGTGRLLLYSYQRANAYSFGEVARIFGMRKDSKQMLAWYAPSAGYAEDRTPNAGPWKPVTWIGSHWESNGHTGNHKHFEIEIPDKNGALHGRFEILFGKQSDDSIGLDKTLILTNQSDFVVRCHGTDTDGNDIQQALRLSAAAGFEKAVEWSVDTDGVGKRWKLRSTSEAESGDGAGSNMQLIRYSDGGVLVDAPFQVIRSSGQVVLGGTGGTSAGLAVYRSGGVAVTVNALAAGGQALLVNGADNVSAAYQATVTGDTTNRYRVFTDGKTEWGPGNTARDVNLYRSSAGVLRTDQSLHVAQNLRMNTTSVGGGVGVIGLANATTAPTGSPTGGGVLFARNGALFWRGSSGTETQIAVA